MSASVPALLLAKRYLVAGLLLAVAAATLPACGSSEPHTWRDMFRDEEVIHEITPLLERLAFGIANLSPPDPASRQLFLDGAWCVDVDPRFADVEARADPGLGLRVRALRPSPGSHCPPSSAGGGLWESVLGEVAWFRHAAFAVASGRTDEADPDSFDTELRFSATARLASGEVASFDLPLRVVWRRLDGGAPAWRIARWETRPGELVSAPGPFFEEVLDRALPEPGAIERARTSLHERKVSDYLLALKASDGQAPRPHPWFQIPSWDRHPGLAVADVDADGWDDVYLMARWGPNQLLRNRGDGTFEEVAADLGIALADHSSSAVFADFDNDGDLDLFLGRTLAPSRYYEREEGRFVDRTHRALAGTPPQLVSSLSAVDYDADGLLDVYASTYAADVLATLVARVRPDPEGRRFALVPFPFLPLAELQEMWRGGGAGSSPLLDARGPRNVLLHNVGGGRFERVTGTPLDAWRHTFQTTWTDFDGDGLPDAYLANDFAPDALVRNAGGGRFVDVSAERLDGSLGLAMGASFGDYDHDGRHDLYVTNMHSKAGLRVTSALGDLPPGYAEAASGNRLLRNEPAGFRCVSGTGPSDLPVAAAGWGWGSLFADVDNDGFLDLHALSGFFTAPRSVAGLVDS